jgi:hypothetical protein
MTDTAAWQDFYRHIQAEITKHGVEILDAEKTREIVQHQEGVKVLKALVSVVRKPVDDLTHLINSMTLFRPVIHTAAEFNTALGRIDLKRID